MVMIDIRKRKLDDAHATIPFLLGAFSAKPDLCLARPLASFFLPTIDLKTGKWTMHAAEPIQQLQTGLRTWQFRMERALDLFDVKVDAKTTKQTCALAQVLEEFAKVEDACIKAVSTVEDTNTSVVVQNLIKYRKKVFGKLDELESADRGVFMKAHETRVQELKNLPFEKLSSRVACDELDYYETFLKADKHSQFDADITAQETSAHTQIVKILNAIKTYYGTTATTVIASTFKSELFSEARQAYKSATKSKFGHWDNAHKINSQINRVLEDFLIERIELFYCCVRTAFVLLNGEHETSKALDKFVNHAVAACTAPLLFHCADQEQESLKDGIEPGASKKTKYLYMAYKTHKEFPAYLDSVFDAPKLATAQETATVEIQRPKLAITWKITLKFEERSKKIDAFEKQRQDFVENLFTKNNTSNSRFLSAYTFGEEWMIRDSVSKSLRTGKQNNDQFAFNIVHAALETDPRFASLIVGESPSSSEDAQKAVLVFLQTHKSPFVHGVAPSTHKHTFHPVPASLDGGNARLSYMPNFDEKKIPVSLTPPPKPAKKQQPQPSAGKGKGEAPTKGSTNPTTTPKAADHSPRPDSKRGKKKK